jgi:hypothetical protein
MAAQGFRCVEGVGEVEVLVGVSKSYVSGFGVPRTGTLSLDGRSLFLGNGVEGFWCGGLLVDKVLDESAWYECV